MNFDIKQLNKDVWKNIYQNKFTYYSRAVFLQLVLTTVGGFFIRLLFQLILTSSGQENITKDNFVDILTTPLSCLLIIVFILLVSGLIFFEFSALTLMVYYSYKKGDFSWKNNLKTAFLKWKSLGLKQLIFFLIYFILMIPLSNLGLSSIFTQRLFIPKFITGELVKTNFGRISYYAFLVVCAYVNFRLIFSIPLTVINKYTFSYNMKKSIELTKRGKIKLFLLICKFELILSLISLTILGGIAFIFGILDKSGNNSLYNAIFYTLVRIVFFFFLILSKLIIISLIVRVIITYEDFSFGIICYDHMQIKKRKLFAALTSLALIIILGYTGYSLFSVGLNKDLLIIGHRGYTLAGVENSLEALEGAAKANADYVELDILLTKDNKFVVMHDYNLKRLAGINKKVQDMNFDEVVGLPIKQGKFTSRIPSFEEFVKRAKELNIKLLVELKPHGKEPDNYAELFIEEMRRLKVATEYKTMSLNLNIMEEIESKAPEIQTGYVIPLQFGNFALNNVDFFVIEDFSFNNGLALQAQSEGKEVFVWTINEPDIINKYLHTSVAAIISDRPDVIEQERNYEEKEDIYFDKLYRLLSVDF